MLHLEMKTKYNTGHEFITKILSELCHRNQEVVLIYFVEMKEQTF